jgi:Ran GTPase-activating protein (RanGAP) involved in mRNA processing and transport
VPEREEAYLMSLAMTDRRTVAYTKLCDVSASTLVDTISDYIEREGLVDAVLHCVDLSRNRDMSCESLARIFDMLLEYHIQGVDLSGNQHLGDGIVPTIQPLLEAKKSHLSDLKLAGCDLSVPGLKCLVNAASTSRLRLLDISDIGISDESELIEQVLELPMIEELAFRVCNLGPSDVCTVAKSLPFTSVKALDLRGNTFGSQGLLHLASALPESMVEHLNLSNVGIEPKCEGLTQLAKAWVKRPFPELCLQNNPMGYNEVMKYITALQALVPNETMDETFMGNANIGCC